MIRLLTNALAVSLIMGNASQAAETKSLRDNLKWICGRAWIDDFYKQRDVRQENGDLREPAIFQLHQLITLLLAELTETQKSEKIILTRFAIEPDGTNSGEVQYSWVAEFRLLQSKTNYRVRRTYEPVDTNSQRTLLVVAGLKSVTQ